MVKQHEQRPGNVLEEAEKVIIEEPEKNEPDLLSGVVDQEGGEDGGTE